MFYFCVFRNLHLKLLLIHMVRFCKMEISSSPTLMKHMKCIDITTPPDQNWRPGRTLDTHTLSTEIRMSELLSVAQ